MRTYDPDKAARKAIRGLRDLGLLPRGAPIGPIHEDRFDMVNELAAAGYDSGQIINEVCDFYEGNWP